jgi:hypothetical protein
MKREPCIFGRLGLFGWMCVLLCAGAARGQLFQRPAVVATSAFPDHSGVVWATTFLHGDLDGDGKEDLVYFFPGNTVYQGNTLDNLLFGNGDGTFAPLVSGAENVAAISLVDVVAGYNAAGRQAVISLQGTRGAGQQAEIVMTPYLPTRSYDAANLEVSVFAASGGKAAVFPYLAAVDLNGDGVNDLVTADSANGVVYTLLNNGVGSYTVAASVTLPAGAGAGPIVVGDFNQDGKSDFAFLDTTNHVVLLFYGKGDGTFVVPETLTLQGGVSSILSATIQNGVAAGSGPNRDIVAEGANGALSVFYGAATGPNTGLGLTAVPIAGAQNGPIGQGGHLVGAADLNGDGTPDIVTATPAGISVLLGNATSAPYRPSYTLRGIYDAGPGHTTYAVADFNGDGKPDVAVDGPEGVVLLFGVGDGSLKSAVSYAAGQPALSGALGHFTASGYWDAVVSTEAFQGQVLLGAGDGTFRYLGSPNTPVPTAVADATTAGLWSSVQAADFNGDGLSDLLFTEDGPTALLPGPTGSGVEIQEGAGAGTFGTPATFSISPVTAQNCPLVSSLFIGHSAIADFNGDGVPDLANRDAREMAVFQSVPGVSPYPIPLPPTVVADTACTAHAHDQLVTGDFNKDGLNDLVVQTDGHLTLRLNQGPTSNGQIFAVAAGDLSVDGSLTTAGQATAPVLSSTFGQQVAVSAGGLPFPAFIGSMAVADLDGDGNQDLIVAYGDLKADPTGLTVATPSVVYVWFGSGGGKFLTSGRHPVNPVRLVPSRSFYQVVAADVNGDGVPDLVMTDGYLLSVQLGAGDGTFGVETHYLAGQGINSISLADLRGKGVQDIVVANGGAVLTNPVANGGTLAANTDVNTGGITVLLHTLTQVLLPVTGTVAASPEPTVYGQPFTLTATLTQPSGQASPTGSVTFSIDGTVVGTGTVAGGVASFTVTTAAITGNLLNQIYWVGAHTLSAAYSGDGNYNAATLTGSHTVTGQQSVSSITTLDQNIYYGQEIGYDFGVDAILGANPADPLNEYGNLDGGVLNTYIDTTLVCTIQYNLGGRCADGPFEGYQVGSYTTYVQYDGNQYFAPSTSPMYPVTVMQDTTATGLVSSANPSTQLQPVTLTATVGASYPGALAGTVFPTVVGTVQFFDGLTAIGTAAVNAQGVATLTTPALLVGSHSITACYQNSRNFMPSCSPVLTQVVKVVPVPVATVALLTSSLNPSIVGQAVTFTAAVETTGAIPTTPAGSVSFYDGTTLLQAVALNASGVATLTTATLAAGVHAVTAVYAGNASGNEPTAASTSAALQQVVLVSLPPESGYLLIVTPTTVSVGVGSSVTLSVAVTGVNPAGQPFVLGCGQLPSGVTCHFAQSTLPANGGATSLTITTTAPHACGASTPYFVARGGASGGGKTLPWLALIGVAILGGLRRRRGLRGLVLAVVVCLSLGVASAPLVGCGGCTDLGTQPLNYHILVSATAQGVAATNQYATESQAVNLNVHL